MGGNNQDDLGNSHNNHVFWLSPWLIQILLLSRQYLVVVPSQLYTGVPEKACVMLNHLNETVTLHVILENGTHSKALLTDLVAEKDSFHCSSFIVSITLRNKGYCSWKHVLVDALHSDPPTIKKHNEENTRSAEYISNQIINMTFLLNGLRQYSQADLMQYMKANSSYRKGFLFVLKLLRPCSCHHRYKHEDS